eukprot:m.136452 g.136452  ORF g.136452 m.136452 type:complete len:303 (-) comp13944_c0_seq3:778-1686(-)
MTAVSLFWMCSLPHDFNVSSLVSERNPPKTADPWWGCRENPRPASLIAQHITWFTTTRFTNRCRLRHVPLPTDPGRAHDPERAAPPHNRQAHLLCCRPCCGLVDLGPGRREGCDGSTRCSQQARAEVDRGWTKRGKEDTSDVLVGNECVALALQPFDHCYLYPRQRRSRCGNSCASDAVVPAARSDRSGRSSARNCRAPQTVPRHLHTPNSHLSRWVGTASTVSRDQRRRHLTDPRDEANLGARTVHCRGNRCTRTCYSAQLRCLWVAVSVVDIPLPFCPRRPPTQLFAVLLRRLPRGQRER